MDFFFRKKLNTFITLLLIGAAMNLQAQSGRIAVVADGNTKDSDDIAATALTIAILAANNLQYKLVHYSHSCHLDPAWTSKSEFSNRETYMQESLFGAAARYGGFDKTDFFNVTDGVSTAAEHLAKQIDASAADDILWIAEAGETDVIYDAFVLAEQAKRQYVRIITHHPNNDVAYDSKKDLADILALAGCSSSQRKEIKFQNNGLYKPKSEFYWMRDHSDERITFLWERGVLAEEDQWSGMNTAGNLDYSDAGMIWWWLTGATSGGDQDCNPTKVKDLLEPYVASNDPITSPNGELLHTFFAKDFTYTGFYLDNNDDIGDVLAIDPDPTNSGTDAVQSGTAEYTYTGESGTFDVYFHGVGEKDGEAPIEVFINGTKIGGYSIPLSTLEWELDKKFNMAFYDININDGDKIIVKGKTASNGGEWSRCRWQKLELYGVKPTEIGAGIWVENDGYVVIEPEDVVIHEEGKWEIRTTSTGYLGNGYIVWLGGNYFDGPGSTYLSFKIKINNPGTYTMNWRNRVGKGDQTSEHNDTWIQFPDAADFYAQIGGSGTKKWPKGSGKTPNPAGASADNYLKVYQYAAGLPWTWSTKSGDREDGWVKVDFTTPGVYELRISPRSDYHLIDRITLAKTDKISIATDLTTSKSSMGGTDSDTMPVTGVLIPSDPFTITEGAQKTILASVLPDNARNKSVTWISDNSAIASISTSGLVTGVAVGQTVLRVTTLEGGYTDSCVVQVDSAAPNGLTVNFDSPTHQQTFSDNASVYVKVDAITESGTVSNVKLYLNGAMIRQENVAPYEWNASGQNDGALKMMATGEYALQAIATNSEGATTAKTIIITVGDIVAVSGINVTPDKVTIKVGENTTLAANILPANATNKSIIYSSGDSDIATVGADGIVKGVSEGIVSITAKSVEGNYTATATVTVIAGSSISHGELLDKPVLFPNPVQQTLFIELQNNKGDIRVTDLTGKTVMYQQLTGSSNQIDFSRFEKGMYVAIVASDNRIYQQVILKE